MEGTSSHGQDDSGLGNPVGKLQEMCLSQRWQPPVYELKLEAGSPHERHFVIECTANGLQEVCANVFGVLNFPVKMLASVRGKCFVNYCFPVPSTLLVNRTEKYSLMKAIESFLARQAIYSDPYVEFR